MDSRMRRLMRAKGFKIMDVADRLDITKSSAWEMLCKPDKWRESTVERMAVQVFDVETWELEGALASDKLLVEMCQSFGGPQTKRDVIRKVKEIDRLLVEVRAFIEDLPEERTPENRGWTVQGEEDDGEVHPVSTDP